MSRNMEENEGRKSVDGQEGNCKGRSKKELLDTLEEVIDDLQQAVTEIIIMGEICDDFYNMPEEDKTSRMKHIYDACDRNGDSLGRVVMEHKKYLEDARAEVSA